MPDYSEICDLLLTEVTEAALAEQRASDEEAKRLNRVLVDVSQQIHDNPNIDRATKEYLEEYRNAIGLLAFKEHRMLYLQGAKDIVCLLRKFGVIK